MSQPSEIKLADSIPGAEYTNLMQVGHNKEEFQLIFANVLGAGGKVVSKIITSPGHMKRIVSALKDNIEKYEKQFGSIEEAAAPDKQLGFKAE